MAHRPLPLYNREGDLLAWWIGDFLWTADMRWLGYVYEGHVFRSDDNRWLGPADVKGLVFDTSGRVVLWTPDINVNGLSHVYRPATPYRPPRPETPPKPNPPHRPGKPPRPSGGWSPHTFKQWVRFKDTGPQNDESRPVGEDYGMISFDED